ncbi:MAG: hypothetical protein LH491_01915, partial [Pseudoxanthomonas sp.]|nr:hypothetical protein [Pseudoxanthomonas sp.]
MPRPNLHDRILALRKLRIAQGRVRVRRTIARRDGVRVEVDGRWLTEFCGNDYLGLSQQYEVVTALQDAAARDGARARAPHQITGPNPRPHPRARALTQRRG